MTKIKALAEARRRWGKRALIEDKGKRDNLPHALWTRFNVGRNMMGMFFEVLGSSNESFEAAFDDASAHGH